MSKRWFLVSGIFEPTGKRVEMTRDYSGRPSLGEVEADTGLYNCRIEEEVSKPGPDLRAMAAGDYRPTQIKKKKKTRRSGQKDKFAGGPFASYGGRQIRKLSNEERNRGWIYVR